MFLDRALALVLASFFAFFWAAFYTKGKLSKSNYNNLNKQLALAKILSILNRKKVRVAAMAHPHDFNAASKLSDYQIKCK